MGPREVASDVGEKTSGAEQTQRDAERILTGEEYFFRYQAGDEGAFDALIALYEAELFRFIHGIVNDYHESKHLTIDSFANLAVGGGKFSENSSLKTYLFAIGKNLALRYMKMRGRVKHIPYEEVVGTLMDGGESPYEFMEREENRRLLREAMRELKADHRTVLNLLYFEDMSYTQTGKAMGKTETQISSLAHRAKAALKKRLESGGYTYA
jgi:RNA polymerase sigma-70 factor (ECF subfamily)